MYPRPMEKSDQLRELFQMKTVINERPDDKRNEVPFKRQDIGNMNRKENASKLV